MFKKEEWQYWMTSRPVLTKEAVDSQEQWEAVEKALSQAACSEHKSRLEQLLNSNSLTVRKYDPEAKISVWFF